MEYKYYIARIDTCAYDTNSEFNLIENRRRTYKYLGFMTEERAFNATRKIVREIREYDEYEVTYAEVKQGEQLRLACILSDLCKMKDGISSTFGFSEGDLSDKFIKSHEDFVKSLISEIDSVSGKLGDLKWSRRPSDLSEIEMRF